MKKQIVFWSFAGATGLAVILRLCQMLAFTEFLTGFMKRESSFAYILLSVIIGLLVLCVPVFALISSPAPKQSGRFDLVSSVAAILLCGACVLDVLFLYSSASDVPAFLKVTCVALGVLSALYFAAAGIRSVFYFSFSSKFAAIPPAFFTVRAACIFIACSRHAVVSDTVFEVLVFCLSMLLFLEIARVANGAGGKSSLKKIVFFALSVSVLAICFALPKLILSAVYSAALHDNAIGSVLILALGIYAAAFAFGKIEYKGMSGKSLGVYYTGKH